MRIKEMVVKGTVYTDTREIHDILERKGLGWLNAAEIENAVIEIKGRKLRWYAGTWYYGVWENGTWLDGSFRAGVWKDGIWHNGAFTGTWENGVWIQGDFNGVWNGGERRDMRVSESRISDFATFVSKSISKN
jgi:hypothetical protein